VLFQPSYAGQLFGPPLGLLSLAASVREAGYEPVVIDAALHRDYLGVLAREIPGSLCFGVSLLTGPMIHDAIQASQIVRDTRPDLPIVFGGWHPSLCTAQTLNEPFVDIVVRHQGERTLVEILQRLERNRDLHMVQGCWFKRKGRIHQNPDRPVSPLSDLPLPAYDLVDFDAYEAAVGDKKLPYATSIGCPYACNYCTDMVFYNRRFNPYRVEEVTSEVVSLVRRHRLAEVALVDSNFLVDTRRAMAIARGFLDSGVKFRWSFQTSTDLLCRLTDEEVELLAASGVSHIGFGTESASPEVLRAMNKRHQEIDDMYETARKCSRARIRATFNLIFGYPGESEDHRSQTLRVMGEIGSRYEYVTFSPNVFTPYPGIPIWPQLRELGVSEPDSLTAWADVDLGTNHLPWLQGKSFERLSRGISYFLLNNKLDKMRRRSRSAVVQKMIRMLRRPLHWRIRNHFFSWPLELWLVRAQRRLVVRRSLLTGQPLSHELSKAA
jgi:radical SAM superfamily enzyme YgiQ (UPF0313 family)